MDRPAAPPHVAGPPKPGLFVPRNLAPAEPTMIYGLYLSASGLIANSHKQDVIANNLANSETAGFKRDVPLFQQRMTEAEQRQNAGMSHGWSDPTQEGLGGGLFICPNAPDLTQGDMEHTGSPLDVAIEGDGYFAVRSSTAAGAPGTGAAPLSLTRNGQFMVDGKGYLVLGTEQAQQVLDADKQPIHIAADGGQVSVGRDGTLTQGGKDVGRLGVFAVADRTKLTKQGGTLMSVPESAGLTKSDAALRGEFVERSNVDPTTELSELMKTQRLLEANANMIRIQDTTLQKLVNEVGKIS
jgi:flagellar basal-body rod protein FlgF